MNSWSRTGGPRKNKTKKPAGPFVRGLRELRRRAKRMPRTTPMSWARTATCIVRQAPSRIRGLKRYRQTTSHSKSMASNTLTAHLRLDITNPKLTSPRTDVRGLQVQVKQRLVDGKRLLAPVGQNVSVGAVGDDLVQRLLQ